MQETEGLIILALIILGCALWYYKNVTEPIAKTKNHKYINVPIKFQTPLRGYLALAIQLGTESKSVDRNFISALMFPIACFGIKNIPKSEEVNSDITLIKIASVYYNILLARAIKMKYDNVIPDIQQSLKEFNTAATYARKISFEEVVALQDTIITNISWIEPNLDDIVDIIAVDVFNCDVDSDAIDLSIQQTLVDIEYAVKIWGNSYLPTIFKVIDDYARTNK